MVYRDVHSARDIGALDAELRHKEVPDTSAVFIAEEQLFPDFSVLDLLTFH